MKLKAALATALMLVVLQPSLVTATHRDVEDPNDARGKLDVKRVAVYGKPPIWNIETYRRWRLKKIWDRGYWLVRYDTFGDERLDYFALVRSNGRRLRGALHRDRRVKSDFRVGKLKTWRPKPKSVKVKVPLGKMRIGAERTFYRWYAETLFSGRRCRQTCFDVAPDGDAVEEPLPSSPPPGAP